MTDQFQTLYAKLLNELHQELLQTEKIHLEISQNILKNLAGSSNHFYNKKLQVLEETYQQKISRLIADLGKIHPAEIEIFPIPENAGLLQRLEICNRQTEELENLLNLLFEQNNMKMPSSGTEENFIQLPDRSVCPAAPPEQDAEETRPVICVCGNYASGKTSLIQAVTRLNTSICSKDDSQALTVLETKAAIFIDSQNMNFEELYIEDFQKIISDKLNINKINCFWYCIDGSSMQLSRQLSFLNRHLRDNFLLVVTKCDLMQKEQTLQLMQFITEYLHREQVIFVSSENGTGLSRLVDLTQKLCSQSVKNKNFRKNWKSFFSNKSDDWQDIMSDEADCYISWAEKRVSEDSLDSEETFLVCKLASIYGTAANDAEISMLKKHTEKNASDSAAAIIRSIGKAAKACFKSDTVSLKKISLKRK